MRRLEARAAAFAAVVLVLNGASAQSPGPGDVEKAEIGSNLFSVGTLRAAQGALPPTLWRGANADDLRFLLENAPGRPANPVSADLMRRVLLSPGAPPEGVSDELAGLKLSLLARTGSTEGARSVASLADVQSDPFAARALAEADLIDGDLRNACLKGERLKEGRDRSFWLKLRLVCYAASDESEAADLTLSLLQDEGSVDEVSNAIFSSLVSDRRPRRPPAPRDPLELAAAREAGLPIETALSVSSDASVLRAIALDETVSESARLQALQRAAFAGAVSPGEIRAVLQSPTVSLKEISEAAAVARRRPDDARTDALLFQAIAEMTAPELADRKLELIDLALTLPKTPERLQLMATALRDDIADIPPTRENAAAASSFVFALLSAGDGQRAASWIATLLPGPDGRPKDGAWKNPQLAADLTHYLEPLEPRLASALRSIAAAEGAEIEPPVRPRIIDLDRADDGAPFARDPAAYAAGLVDALVACVETKASGLCALTAVAADEAPAQLGAMGEVVRERALEAAGLEEDKAAYRFHEMQRRRLLLAEVGADGERD